MERYRVRERERALGLMCCLVVRCCSDECWIDDQLWSYHSDGLSRAHASLLFCIARKRLQLTSSCHIQSFVIDIDVSDAWYDQLKPHEHDIQKWRDQVSVAHQVHQGKRREQEPHDAT